MTCCEIVRYDSRFKTRVAQLQTHLWSTDLAVNVAYLEWKYERNPYLTTPMIHLAVCDGQIVAMRGIYGALWQVGASPRAVQVPCAADLAIDPQHRNRGLGARIMEAAAVDLTDAGYEFVFNLSASLATQIGSLATGWRSIGPLEVAVRQREEPVFVTRAVAAARRLRAPLPALRRLWSMAGTLSVGGAVRPHDPFSSLDVAARLRAKRPIAHAALPRPDAMAELVVRIGRDGRIRHVRDEGYFAWRFQNPLSVYRFLFWEDERLEGYLVLQAAARDRNGAVTIVDWEATHAKAREDLLRAAIDWGRFETLRIWSATLPPESRQLMEHAGFRVADRPRSIGHAHRDGMRRPMLLVKAVGRARPETSEWAIRGRPLLDMASWDVRGVYSDTF